jgi:hypothetical protein
MADGVEELLESLKGVVRVKAVSEEVRDSIGKSEARSEHGSFLPIYNLGIRSVLEKDEVWVILKDAHFRPPPRPTVYLVEEVQSEEPAEDQQLIFEGKKFRILGEEILPHDKEVPAHARRIGDGFAFFPDRRNDPKIPSYFLIPPIEFPELDGRCEALRIKNIWSVSPSALTDQYIRTTLAFPQDDAYATILIGFDRL